MWRLGSKPHKEMAAVSQGARLLSFMRHRKNLGNLWGVTTNQATY
jgi:hypothetical protein